MNRYHTVVIDAIRGQGVPDLFGLFAMPVPEVCAEDAVMWAWAGLAGEGMFPHMDIDIPVMLSSWGFEPRLTVAWHRTGKHGYGLPLLSGIGTSTVEYCILATRGQPDIKGLGQPPYIDTLFEWQVPSTPKEKPAGFWRMVEETYRGPYLAAFITPPTAFRGHWDQYDMLIAGGGL